MQRIGDVHVLDPLGKELYDISVVLDIVGNQSVASAVYDAALVLFQGGLEILAQNECETVAGNGVVGFVMKLERDS